MNYYVLILFFLLAFFFHYVILDITKRNCRCSLFYFSLIWTKILLSVAYGCNGNQRISRLWNFLLQTHHLHGISRLFDFSLHIIITLHGWIFNHLKFSNVLHSINPIQSNASWLCFPLYFLYLSSVCMYLTGNNKQVGTVVIQILTLFLWFKIEINEQKKGTSEIWIF